MTKYPANEPVNEVLLGTVPKSTYATDYNPIGGGKGIRMSDYNVAAWLSVTAPAILEKVDVKLLLKYTDARGQHTKLVDRGQPDERGCVLLAGIASVEAAGAMTDMRAFAQVTAQQCSCHVEELYVQLKTRRKALAEEFFDAA
jgi:hypothetical protein